jgi:hypothetical protein
VAVSVRRGRAAGLSVRLTAGTCAGRDTAARSRRRRAHAGPPGSLVDAAKVSRHARGEVNSGAAARY